VAWRLLHLGLLALAAGLAWPAAGAGDPALPPGGSPPLTPLVSAAPHWPPAEPERVCVWQAGPPQSACLLTGERASTPRAELRQPGLKFWLPPDGRDCACPVPACRPLASLPPARLPRSRLHVLLCTWLN
jgi:hypothetical protein